MSVRRARAKAIVKSLRGAPDAAVLRAALAAEKRLGFEILRAAPRAISAASRTDIESFGEGMAEWAHVDCFASFAGGVAWRLGVIADGVVHRWARSRDRWWRRAALVSTVPLNCRARGAADPQPERTLAVCELLLDDRDDMVVKAMSWALRELAKRDPRPVEQFLGRHQDRIAARVRREVGNKLRTGLKAKRYAVQGVAKSRRLR
jgi:3-methyladenine DNA glycosylase AlkD